MVMVKVYVEGAGHTDFERTKCRQAFSTFFAAAGLTGKRLRTVPCGGRQSAYDAFVTALNNAGTDELPLLLVDSEDFIIAGQTSWQHLKAQDNWDRPTGASDDQAFLMVQVMETWFLADRELLRTHFTGNLIEHHLPAWQNLEAVSKVNILTALERATANCNVPYQKGTLSFEILAKLDPNKVEVACPHARSFLQRLRALP
ncbi:MAG: DUF4276 family protein [Armatimonadota bacterium]